MTQADSAGGPLAGVKVLIVDDEFLIAIELEAVFRDAGAAEVIICGSVSEALEAIDEDGFDVAVLDVRLGSETSDPVADRLDEDGVPFIFYSGQDLPKTLRQRHQGVLVARLPPVGPVMEGEDQEDERWQDDGREEDQRRDERRSRSLPVDPGPIVHASRPQPVADRPPPRRSATCPPRRIAPIAAA